MPLVPSAGYQTESFPQTRAPDRPSEDYQNIQARPEMFGAQVGQAQERFGAIAERGATELADRAVQIQLLNNQILADKAQSDYTQRSNKLLYGDPSDGTVGLFAKHGAEAQEAARQIGPTLDKLRDDMASGLPNARARLEFNEYTRRQRMFQDRDIFSHYERETQAYGAEVQKAAVTGAIQHAGLNYNDPEQIAESDKKSDQASIRQAENLGLKLTDEATANLVHLGRDHIAQAVVEGYLSHNDPVGAENFLKTREVYDPKIAEALHKLVKGQALDADVKGFLFGGSKEAPNLSPYSPSPQVQTTTGMSTGQYDIYRHFLAGHESSRYDEPPNAKGYMGRYQMGKSEIEQAANRLGVPIPTQSEFLSNPDLQEKLFDAYTTNNSIQLMQHPVYANASPAGRAAILAGAHLGGATGVQKYLDTGGAYNPSDGHTRISDYVNGMATAMGGQGPTQAFDLGNIIKGVRERYPDPQDFAKAMTSVEGMMRMMNMQGAAEKKQQDDLDQKTANGFMATILKPGSDLSGMSAQLSQAVTDGKLKWETAQRLEAAIAKDDPTDRKYGPGFWDAYKRVTLPVGDPNRLTDVNQILQMAGPAGPLNLAGAKELTNILESKKTPVGEGEAELQKQIFVAAHHQLSAQIPGFKDTMGETQMLKFMQVAVPMIEKLKSEGKSMGEIADLEKGPLAATLKSLKRSPDQMVKDMMVDPTGPDLTGQPTPQSTGVPIARPGAAPTTYHYDTSGNRIP